MPKQPQKARLPKPNRPRDVNQLAHQLVRESTEQRDADTPEKRPQPTPSEADISRVMSELGRRGGKRGGVIRANNLTKEQRREIALKAARARWDKEAKQA